MVTAEHKVNRFGSHYIYYHCSKRNNGPRCPEPSVEAKDLEAQFDAFLERITIDDATHGETVGKAVQESISGMSSIEMIKTEIKSKITETKNERSELVRMRARGLIADEQFLAESRRVEVGLAALEERDRKLRKEDDWFEPAELLISFCNRAMGWFRCGTEELKRLTIATVGSNYRLTGRKLSGDARSPFTLSAEEPLILYGCGQGDHTRTSIELCVKEAHPLVQKSIRGWIEPQLNDPDFVQVIANIRKLKAMAEEPGIDEDEDQLPLAA
jgi:hypothetical protein